MVSSLTVAEVFEKRHNNVLRDIENLDCSADFRNVNFNVSKYKPVGQKRSYKCYNMAKDGFARILTAQFCAVKI